MTISKKEKREYDMLYREKNRVKILSNKKNYRETHKPERNKHERERRQKDLKYRLKTNLSGMIRKRIGRAKNKKSTKDIIGYSYSALEQHLEKQFCLNMSWGNYKTYWVIDHIRPQSWFDFEKTPLISIKEANKLSNLQPLPAWINNIKKDKCALCLKDLTCYEAEELDPPLIKKIMKEKYGVE